MMNLIKVSENCLVCDTSISARPIISKRIKSLILFLYFLSLSLLTWPVQEIRAEELHLLAGAGLRQPVDRLIDMFQKETGHKVFVDYAGGGYLLPRIIASGQGDLFISPSLNYIQALEKEDMVDSYRSIVSNTPVIGVNRDKDQLISSFDDLARPGVRLALGDPEAMAFGRIAMEILEKSKMKEEILKNVVVQGATVKQLALYVAQGDVDASIIGRADAIQYKDKIKIVPIPEEYLQTEIVAVALLRNAAGRPEAIRFRDFMSNAKAIEIFQQFGFLPLGEAER
jgi:molybdate transport system substrate-binding protein